MARRSRQLKPLSNEHHQALLVAFQLKNGLAGHGDSAGAPKDLPGLISLVRRFDASLLRSHFRAEEELLGAHLTPEAMRRLTAEHTELKQLLETALQRAPDARRALMEFAMLLDRHVRWEERELYPSCEASMDEAALADIGHELERRLVLSHKEAKTLKRV